jgi:hypothetical protein
LKKKSELGLTLTKKAAWSSRSNAIPTSSHFKIFFGFFLDSKRRDLGFYRQQQIPILNPLPVIETRDGIA